MNVALLDHSSSSSAPPAAAPAIDAMELAVAAVWSALRGNRFVAEQFVDLVRLTRCHRFLLGSAWHAMLIGVIVLHLSLVIVENDGNMLHHSEIEHAEPRIVWEIIELFFLVVYFVELTLRLIFFRRRLFCQKGWGIARGWYLVFVLVSVACAADLTYLWIDGGDYMTRPARCLRPLLLISRSRLLRRPLRLIARTVRSTLPVLALCAIVIVFFSVVGMDLFSSLQCPGYAAQSGDVFDRSDGVFDDALEAALATFTMTTTENYPGVFYPALQSRPAAASVFFTAFMSISIWSMVPLFLAKVYDSYGRYHASTAATQRDNEHRALYCAFTALVPEPDGVMDENTFTALLMRTHPKFTTAQRRAIFDALAAGLDDDGSIDCSEFLGLRFALKFHWEGDGDDDEDESKNLSDHPLIAPNRQSGEEERLMLIALRKRCVPVFLARLARRSPCVANALRAYSNFINCRTRPLGLVRLQSCARAVAASRAFAAVVRIASLLAVVLSLLWSTEWQSQFNHCLDDHESALSGCLSQPLAITNALSLVPTAIAVFEVGTKLCALGIPHWSDDPWNIADAIIVALNAIAVPAMLCFPHLFMRGSNSATSSFVDVGDIIEFCRALRILRPIAQYEEFRAIVESIAECVGAVCSLVVLMGCAVYSFALLGMVLFREVPSETEAEQAEQRFTFHTFRDSVLVLFQFCTENNWNSVMYPNARQTNRLYAIYFVAFFLIVVTIGLNIVNGVFIDGIQLAEAEAAKQRDAEAEANEMLAREWGELGEEDAGEDDRGALPPPGTEETLPPIAEGSSSPRSSDSGAAISRQSSRGGGGGGGVAIARQKSRRGGARRSTAVVGKRKLTSWLQRDLLAEESHELSSDELNALRQSAAVVRSHLRVQSALRTPRNTDSLVAVTELRRRSSTRASRRRSISASASFLMRAAEAGTRSTSATSDLSPAFLKRLRAQSSAH